MLASGGTHAPLIAADGAGGAPGPQPEAAAVPSASAAARSPPPPPASPPGHAQHPGAHHHGHPAPPAAGADGPQPLRVARSPLKRRSTGLSCRGLSKAYVGKSQSFDCIADVARNPFGCDTALALAKRRAVAAPLAVPGAPARAVAVGARDDGRRVLSLGEPSLAWSIDEGDECPLATGRGSGSGCGGPAGGGGGGGIGGASSGSEGCSSITLGSGAFAFGGGGGGGWGGGADDADDAGTRCSGGSSLGAGWLASLQPQHQQPQPPRPPRPLARRSWDCTRRGWGGGDARMAPAAPLRPRDERPGGGAVPAADEALCSALQGARLSPPGGLLGDELWLGAPALMDSG
ncbi:hypothetical protein Rsub_04763 [Raphidocelis subcapitata]|uniref:Uncharacterized protein n=1 Tax=Raphidocelis subcapitata TaxID=307507 RepID=A0A2V0NTY1_9CHLO|nr:hypothetical protein Rsub_04763 [Raphidocelis subcapitata]|eukprot:GBF91094.1 hypothetical protein Rsub_04763 [Raphidocelis subcapitata]